MVIVWQSKVTKMAHNIEIKGIREGILITLGDGEWSEINQSLLSHVDNQKDFLQGAKLTLEVGNHILKAADLGWLRDQLSERGIFLRAVLSNSPTTERTAQALGLATKLSKPRSERITNRLDTALQGDKAVLIKRTLRSGHSIKHPGHVTIIGDVNPGAEIVAGGNVVVWGRLRGTVHAGAQGDEDAVVCALDLSPTQLRIAEQISITPPQRKRPKPEIARLEDGKVIAEAWKIDKKSRD
jgi:septum site-determining protein MinC